MIAVAGASRIRSTAQSILFIYPDENHLKVLYPASSVSSSYSSCSSGGCPSSIGTACAATAECISLTCGGSPNQCGYRSPKVYESTNGLTAYTQVGAVSCILTILSFSLTLHAVSSQSAAVSNSQQESAAVSSSQQPAASCSHQPWTIRLLDMDDSQMG